MSVSFVMDAIMEKIDKTDDENRCLKFLLIHHMVENGILNISIPKKKGFDFLSSKNFERIDIGENKNEIFINITTKYDSNDENLRQ